MIPIMITISAELSVSDQPETDPTTYVHNNIMLTSRQLSIAPSATISGGQLPTPTVLPVVLTSTETG